MVRFENQFPTGLRDQRADPAQRWKGRSVEQVALSASRKPNRRQSCSRTQAIPMGCLIKLSLVFDQKNSPRLGREETQHETARQAHASPVCPLPSPPRTRRGNRPWTNRSVLPASVIMFAPWPNRIEQRKGFSGKSAQPLHPTAIAQDMPTPGRGNTISRVEGVKNALDFGDEVLVQAILHHKTIRPAAHAHPAYLLTVVGSDDNDADS